MGLHRSHPCVPIALGRNASASGLLGCPRVLWNSQVAPTVPNAVTRGGWKRVVLQELCATCFFTVSPSLCFALKRPVKGFVNGPLMGWSRFPEIPELFFHSSGSKPNYDKPQKTGRLFSRKYEFETPVWTRLLPKSKNHDFR